MPRLAEQLVCINLQRQDRLTLAKFTYPPVGVRGSKGLKRDRAIAKANAEYYEALHKLGIRTRRRGAR